MDVMATLTEQEKRTSDPMVMGWWADALRSGLYPQSGGALKDSSGWCCLGVLCDVAIRHGQPLPIGHGDRVRAAVPGGDPMMWSLTFFDGSSQYLPDSVVRWAGLSSENPLVRLDEQAIAEIDAMPDMDVDDRYRIGSTVSLAELNDLGIPFPIIAGLVERGV